MEPLTPTDFNAALDRLWGQFLPEIRERVAIIEVAATACAAGWLNPEQCQAAHAAAHKLAGVLGTFGLAEGTALARELEAICANNDAPDPRAAELVAALRNLVESRPRGAGSGA